MRKRVLSMNLPEDFLNRMKKLMGPEFEAFLQSYDRKRAQALRVNTLKISVNEFEKISPFPMRKVPWVPEGFFYQSEQDLRPGKHPYHEAGLYYIQEPSAMAVGTLAAPQPGERVLDLCAAPGGKTTHLASQMKGEGLLISNEIHPERARILAQNVERMGIRNTIVTNEKPQALMKHFTGYFDRIIVDAPCSGEGMFAKEEQAVEQWSLDNVALCAERQQDILESASRMLRDGGTLVYSTCTFSPEENEGTISQFIQNHPEFEVVKMEAYEGFAPGRPEWAEAIPETADTWRLWPHRLEGEGHYIAVLKHQGQVSAYQNEEKLPSIDRTQWNLYRQFAEENLKHQPDGIPILFGEQLYLIPAGLSLKGLKVLRAGLHLGTCKKNRFEPSHALALAMRANDAIRCCHLTSSDSRVKAYLKGDTIPYEGEKGWYLVLVDGYSLGWGKLSDGILKNHYPKGLRW